MLSEEHGFTLLHIAICVVNASLYKDFGYLFTWDMFVLAMEALVQGGERGSRSK